MIKKKEETPVFTIQFLTERFYSIFPQDVGKSLVHTVELIFEIIFTYLKLYHCSKSLERSSLKEWRARETLSSPVEAQLLQFQLQLHIRRYCDSVALLTAKFLLSFFPHES